MPASRKFRRVIAIIHTPVQKRDRADIQCSSRPEVLTPCLCSHAGAMGAARFSLGAPSDSLWPATLSREPWRIRFGAAFGKGFATSEPQRNDPVGLVLGHQSLARNLFFFGRLPSCRSHLEEVLALHNPIFDGSLVHQVGIHPDSRPGRPRIGRPLRPRRIGAQSRGACPHYRAADRRSGPDASLGGSLRRFARRCL